MNHLNLKHKLIKLLMLNLGALVFTTQVVAATPQPAPPPLTIEAVSSELDRNTGIATFIGNVIFDQGETHLRSSRLEVSFNSQNKITKAKATGQLAKYWNTATSNQKVSGQQTMTSKGMQSQAETIIFYPLQHKIELMGRAKTIQNKDVIEAPYIEYHTETGHLVSRSNSTMRTRIILYPAQKTTAVAESKSKEQNIPAPPAATLKFTAEKSL